MEIFPGATVEVCGLKRTNKLNGITGIARCPDPAHEGRWHVAIADPGTGEQKVKSMKSGNLAVVVPAKKQEKDEDQEIATDETQAKPEVELPAGRTEKSSSSKPIQTVADTPPSVGEVQPKPAKATAPVEDSSDAWVAGLRVQAVGFTKRPEMNGRCGILRCADSKRAGYWQVEFSTDTGRPEIKSLAKTHLELQNPAQPSKDTELSIVEDAGEEEEEAEEAEEAKEAQEEAVIGSQMEDDTEEMQQDQTAMHAGECEANAEDQESEPPVKRAKTTPNSASNAPPMGKTLIGEVLFTTRQEADTALGLDGSRFMGTTIVVKKSLGHIAKVLVFSIPPHCTRQHLEGLLSQAGDIRSCLVAQDFPGIRQKGCNNDAGEPEKDLDSKGNKGGKKGGKEHGKEGGKGGTRESGASSSRLPASIKMQTNKQGYCQDFSQSMAMVQAESPSSVPSVDCEGRPFDFSTLVVNFANVAMSYGNNVLQRNKATTTRFDFEGIRKCVTYFRSRGVKVIGVTYQKIIRGTDRGQRVDDIPEDIKEMCSSILQTPALCGAQHKSADDELTIKSAYRRNCRFLDNDNYRDWLKFMRDERVREWLQKHQALLQVKYYFDAGLGAFETLDGNAPLGPPLGS